MDAIIASMQRHSTRSLYEAMHAHSCFSCGMSTYCDVDHPDALVVVFCSICAPKLARLRSG